MLEDKEKRWNPHEYNLKLVESEWKWKVTIVLRTPFSVNHNAKLLNKDALMFVYRVCSELFPNESLDCNSFLGVCTSEKQEASGLLHHHLIFGDFWKPVLWFNDSASKIKRNDREFRLKLVDFFDSLSKQMSERLESTPFNSTYLGKTLELDKNPNVDVYISEKVSGKDWIGYILKTDESAYWSSAYHKLVKRVNDINSRSGMIPDELRHLPCWSKQRVDLDIQARLRLVVENEGGEIE